MRPRRAPRPRLPLWTGKPVTFEEITSQTEAELQIEIAGFLDRFIAPGWEFSHFPAGEKRDASTGAKLKRMGTKPGWPDLILVSPSGEFHGLELKRRGGDLSDEQEAFHERATGRGWKIAVADNFNTALAILNGWRCLRNGIVGGLK